MADAAAFFFLLGAAVTCEHRKKAVDILHNAHTRMSSAYTHTHTYTAIPEKSTTDLPLSLSLSLSLSLIERCGESVISQHHNEFTLYTLVLSIRILYKL